MLVPRGRIEPNFWLHEFPRAEQNLMAVLDDVTLIDAKTDGSLILTLDNRNLFKHPIAMMWEPGFWVMTDGEAARLREYMLKGGFVIFNDFERTQWDNFAAQMGRVIPGARWVPMEATHPIFKLVLPDPADRRASSVQSPPVWIQTGVLRSVRRQRPLQTLDGDRQLQHQPRGVLADGRHRLLPD